MEIVAAVVDVFQAAQVVGHGLAGEIPRLGRLRAAVQGIRRMGQDGREVMGCHELVQGLYIVDIQFADALPRGLREKNWNVSAPIDKASSPMCKNPCETDK